VSEVVRVDLAGEVATITLSRPDKLNALDGAMIAGLQSAADLIEGDRSVRVAILTGAGRAFCAGGDIAAWGSLTPLEMGQDWVRTGHRVFDRLARLKVPMIAALNGHALGGGLELAATADFRICERQSKLGLPETGIGMVPGWSGTQRLVARFGARAVRRLSLTGEIVAADVALAMGLVDEVVETGAAMERAMALAGQVRSRGPVANSIAKQLINAAEGEDEAATMEVLAGALVSYTDDLKEGVAGFREKRPPVFQGR
jgi:enoyl-CoA hydratase/carnithine racemase